MFDYIMNIMTLGLYRHINNRPVDIYKQQIDIYKKLIDLLKNKD